MNKVTVTVDGVVIGTRKTQHTYDWAVIGTQVARPDYPEWEAGKLVVISYHRNLVLAQKAMAALKTPPKTMRYWVGDLYTALDVRQTQVQTGVAR